MPEIVELLKKHDRELVNFYPYAGNFIFKIPCWLIVTPYNFNNLKDIVNCNIKLYSKFPVNSLNVDLKNIGGLEFLNEERLSFENQSVMPIQNDIFQNQIKTSSISEKNINLQSVVQYANFEFELINLEI